MRSLLILCLFCVSPLGWAADWDWDDVTSLDEYIAFDDGAYTWEEIGYYNQSNIGCQTYVINFTSQYWQDASFSTQPVWFHYMLVHIPDNFENKNAAFMFIEGGGNDNDPPDEEGETAFLTCAMAIESKSVGALLKQIPNQPIRYFDDPDERNRTEDANIAWTWLKYMNDQSDPTIVLQFAMTKGAVKALDTINNIVKQKDPESDVNQFMVAGGSKRGWITWLLASTDQRVRVAAPIVLSVLNFNQNLHNHYESLGGWTYVFNDYYQVNLTQRLDEPETQMLMDLVDPYSYRRRLTIPKLLCSATGDEFFMPDDSYNFFDDLPDPKYMVMMHNTNHGLVGSYVRLYGALGAYWIAYLNDVPRPSLNWTIEQDANGGTITMYTDTVPNEVRAYYADTVHPTRRDFRLTTLNGTQPVLWLNATERVEKLDDFTYRIQIDNPMDAQYRGFLLNPRYDGPEPLFDFDMTTEVNIVPAGRPYPPCVGIGCWGELV